jgi:hypothetical protein
LLLLFNFNRARAALPRGAINVTVAATVAHLKGGDLIEIGLALTDV